MALKALLFDVDGTLADTERDGHRVAFNRTFAEAGLDWHWDVPLYGKLLTVAGGRERLRHYVDHYRPDYVKPPDFEAQIERLHAVKTEHYTALLSRGGISLRPGVSRLLSEARAQGIRLALATTTTEANVSALLQHTLGADAESWFEVVGAGDVVAAKKPAPDIYNYVLKKMQLTASQCMAFEDSENGLRAARAAGLKTVITVTDYTKAHDFSGAAIVLDHFGEPDRPFKVLSQTNVDGASFLDLALIRQLHADP